MMKKEKLEQMRELGRGGLSKGLTMLRNAASQAAEKAAEAAAASQQQQQQQSASTATAYAALGSVEEDGGDTTNGAVSAPAAAGASPNKLTYDELVTLSMKLTRQNKLMKTQFQKMQARIALLGAKEADADVLADFVKHVVGVDLDACHVDESKRRGESDGEQSGTIDAKELKERFAIQRELAEREHKRETEQLRAELAALRASASRLPPPPATESVSLLTFSPVGAPPAPELRNYDEIDLFSEPVPAPPAAAADSQTAPLVDFGAFESSNGERVGLADLEKRLSDATAELERLREQVRQSSEDHGELQHKYNDVMQQRSSLESELDAERAKLQRALEASETSEQAWRSRWDEQARVLANIEAELRAKAESASALAAENASIKAQVTELSASQQTERSGDACSDAAIEARVGELNEAIASLRQEVASSQAGLAEAQDEKTALADSVSDLRSEVNAKASEIEKLTAELDTVKRESKESDTPIKSNGSVSSAHADIAPLLDELEKVKMERAEMDHQLRAAHDKLRAAESQQKATQAEIERSSALVEALKEDTSRLADEIAACKREKEESDRRYSSLQAQVAALEDAKEALEEELGVLHHDTRANLESALAEVEETKTQASSAALEKAQLESRMAEEREYLKSKIETLIKELDAANKQSEHLQAVIEEKEKQVKKMASSQASMTAETMELQAQIGAMRQDLHMAAEGLEAHATRAEQSDLKRQESEGKMANMKLQMDSMRDQHLKDFEMLRQEKEAELERVRQGRSAIATKLSASESARSELQVKFAALEAACSEEQQRVADLETIVAQQTTEIGNLSVDLAETKKALSDRMGLATRLQTENMGIAAKQAEQAALIESALRDASASRDKMDAMQIQMQDAKAELERAKRIKEDTVAEMHRMKSEMAQQRAELTSEKERAAVEFKAAVDAEKEAFKRDVERIEAESKHKSKLAIQAVLEKEAEIKRLSSRLAELEEDVRSGDADHRKIFEVAQLQAKREAESRAQALQVQEMAARLDEAYRQIHQLHEEKQRHDSELTALMQTQRREGVNMEYLKNVVVQYMSFRPGSSQQSRLIPVLSTLLQFSASDIKEIKNASSSRRSSWTSWGTETKDYKPILDGKGQRHPMMPPSPAPPSAPSGGRASSFTLSHAMESASSDPSAFTSHSTSESADF